MKHYKRGGIKDKKRPESIEKVIAGREPAVLFTPFVTPSRRPFYFLILLLF